MKQILALTFFLQSLLIVAQDSTKFNYSKLDIEDNNDFTSFAMLDSVLGNYNVFFTGENHLFRTSNYKLQLKMLKYLHQNRGVRHLLLEFGYSRGYLVDMYVQSGDSTIFKTLTDYSYKEYAKLYEGIYEYNQTLEPEDRIHVHGIDLERSYLTSVKLLNMMLPDNSKSVPDSIMLDVEALRSLMGYNDKMYGKEEDEDAEKEKSMNLYSKYGYNSYSEYYTMLEIIQNYKRLDSLYEDYLGEENYKTFDKVIKGMDAEMTRRKYESQRTFHARIYREAFMYNEFVSLIEALPNERFFSQFGRCHTATEDQDEWCNFYHFRTLASRIGGSDHPGLKGKVCSIAAYYPQNEFTWSNAEEHDNILNLMKELDIKKGGLTLVQVGEDSTYFGPITDKFQYLIINNNTLDEDFKVDEDEEEDEYYDPYYGKMFYNFEVAYSLSWYRWSGLNDALDYNGLNKIALPLNSVGGGITIFENTYGYGGMTVEVIPKVKASLDDTTDWSIRGWYVGTRGGAEVTSSELLNLSFYSGFAVSNVRMEVKELNPVPESTGFFPSSGERSSVMSNPGILLDYGVDARINFKAITLGFQAGYQLDVSRKRWIVDGLYTPSSPKTSWSAPYVRAVAGLYIGG